MFALAFIFMAVPGSLIVLVVAYLMARILKLMPAGMSFDWLVVPTLGLAAGGALMGFTLEEFVIRPFQLQSELVGRQLVTPLSLRSYRVWGVFMDPGWTWTYRIDADLAAQLARRCLPDPGRSRVLSRCDIAGASGEGREAFIRIEGRTLTIQEDFH